MKILISLFLALGLFYSSTSLACRPPAKRYSIQAYVMDKLFDTQSKVTKTIRSFVGRSDLITSVEMTRAGYVISISNGCKLTVRPQWGRRGRGMCPHITDFEVRNQSCSAQ